MNTSPIIIEENNLSNAWCKVLEAILNSPEKEITSLLLSLNGFEETLLIRERLDECLKDYKKGSILTVAETIFPASLYWLMDEKRDALYEQYKYNLRWLHKIDKRNRRGLYFERLINYDGRVNQLENIIQSYLKDPSVRRSKLQASVFDANHDHIETRYQGFPCLQHLTFYVTKNNGLVVNAFYAIQYIFERGYGNWLGLINLGKFMAKEMNVTLERFNCYVGVESLDKLSKKEARILLAHLKS